jgi:hypothetical protein
MKGLGAMKTPLRASFTADLFETFGPHVSDLAAEWGDFGETEKVRDYSAAEVLRRSRPHVERTYRCC